MSEHYGSIRILGAGGHAAVAADSWQQAGGTIIAYHSDTPSKGLRTAGPLAVALESGDPLHIAIGSNAIRREWAGKAPNGQFPVVRHPASIASPDALVGSGSLVCAAAILQPRCRIGRHSIINTAALVEHDCEIGDFVHIAPGVRLAGGVTVEDGAFIGIGAVAIPGIRIGAGAVIGAGSVIIRDVEPGAKMAGNPGRCLD